MFRLSFSKESEVRILEMPRRANLFRAVLGTVNSNVHDQIDDRLWSILLLSKGKLNPDFVTLFIFETNY